MPEIPDPGTAEAGAYAFEWYAKKSMPIAKQYSPVKITGF